MIPNSSHIECLLYLCRPAQAGADVIAPKLRAHAAGVASGLVVELVALAPQGSADALVIVGKKAYKIVK